MAIAEELKVVVRAEVDKAKREMQQFNRSLGETKEGATGAGTSFKTMAGNITKMIGIAGGITAVVASVRSLGRAALDAASAFEIQRTEFAVFLGDVEQGEILFNRLRDLSAQTPMQLENITNAAKQLISFGSNAADVEFQIRMLGDAALGNAQKLETLTRAFGRVQARGRATMEEVNMAMEAGLPIIDELAEQMGVTKEAVFDLISTGKVGFEEWQAAFESMTGAGGRFEDAMSKLSETFAGKLSTLKDNWTIFLDALTNLEPLKNAFDFSTRLIQNLTTLVEGNAIGDMFRIIGEGLWDTVRAVFRPENFAVIAGQIGRTFMAIIQANMQMALNMFDNVYDILTNTADKLGEDWLKHLANGIIRGATALPRALLTLLGLEGAATWRPFDTEGPNLGEAMLESLAEQGPEILDTYKEYFQTIVGEGEKLGEALGDAINDPIDEMMQRLRDLVAGLQKDVQELESTVSPPPATGAATPGGSGVTASDAMTAEAQIIMEGYLEAIELGEEARGDVVKYWDAVMESGGLAAQVERDRAAAEAKLRDKMVTFGDDLDSLTEIYGDLSGEAAYMGDVFYSGADRAAALAAATRDAAGAEDELADALGEMLDIGYTFADDINWSEISVEAAKMADALNEAIRAIENMLTGNVVGIIIQIVNTIIAAIRAMTDATKELEETIDDVEFDRLLSDYTKYLRDQLYAEMEIREEKLRELERVFNTEFDVLYDAWQRNLISTQEFTEEMARLGGEYETERANIEGPVNEIRDLLEEIRDGQISPEDLLEALEQAGLTRTAEDFLDMIEGTKGDMPWVDDVRDKIRDRESDGGGLPWGRDLPWVNSGTAAATTNVTVVVEGDNYGIDDLGRRVMDAVRTGDKRRLVSAWGD